MLLLLQNWLKLLMKLLCVHKIACVGHKWGWSCVVKLYIELVVLFYQLRIKHIKDRKLFLLFPQFIK